MKKGFSMMRRCELRVTTRDGQHTACIVTLRDGQLLVESRNGHDIMAQELMDNPVCVFVEGKNKLISAAADPEGWFNGLPEQYHGSMVRAVMIEDCGKGGAKDNTPGESAEPSESAQGVEAARAGSEPRATTGKGKSRMVDMTNSLIGKAFIITGAKEP